MNEKLAKEIVSRTMSIIPYNINVMDKDGTIIGSGDKKRLGDIHTGAISVIQTGKKAVVLEEDGKKRMKKGVNLPIYFHHELIGVIGITGDPDVVGPLGELVKMAAELTVEQAYLSDQIRWNETLRQETLIQLIKGEITDRREFAERAQRLRINLDIERQAIVFILKEDMNLKKRNMFLKQLEAAADEDGLIVIPGAGEIVLLKDSRSSQSPAFLLKMAEFSQQYSLRGAAGYVYKGFNGPALSYEGAKEALASGGGGEGSFIDYKEMALPVLIRRGYDRQKDVYLQDIKNTFEEMDKNGELLDTLRLFFNQNGDMNHTAEELFIHRNTLRYRLDKIEESTSLNPRKMKDLLTLYTALLVV